MTQVDVSNPDLLRTIDPIRKAVYDEGQIVFLLFSHLKPKILLHQPIIL